MSDSQESQKSKLRVTRTSENDIKMRGLEVLLDGEFLTDIGFGKEAVFDIEPGDHTISISNTVYSKKEEFTVAPGRAAVFEVANVVSGVGAVMISAFGVGPYRVDLRRLA